MVVWAIGFLVSGKEQPEVYAAELVQSGRVAIDRYSRVAHSRRIGRDRYDPYMSRAEDAARRAELAAAQERGESLQAQKLIDEFVAAAKAKGIAAASTACDAV